MDPTRPPFEPQDQVAALRARARDLTDAIGGFAAAATDCQALPLVIAQRGAAVFGDYCSVMLVASDGEWIRSAPAFDADPQALARTRAALGEAPSTLLPLIRRVLDSGEPYLIPHVGPEELRRCVVPEHWGPVERIGIHSLMVLPVRSQGRALGVISLVRWRPEQPAFDEHDRDLARSLAELAALAITCARLLEAARLDLAERERAEEALHRTEEQLRHAQKMEAVGRLAGGIAHDFNNMLSVVLSYTDLLLAQPHIEDPVRADVQQIKTAARRAADLTRRLLAFSRQQVLQPKILDLNQTLAALEKMLPRLLGADVALAIVPSPQLGKVRADPGQIEHVVMNLVLNARDAMPAGGKLTIETANANFDEEYVREHLGVLPGPYVMLAVSDTGTGMDDATKARIFEPFFTTKDKRNGTGLGLSTAFGIVQQSGGHIWVYSEPGMGATFKVYLPRAEGGDAARLSQPPVSRPDRGTETILVVEDDEQVRALACGILRRSGYHVLEAPNGGEALLICEQHAARIHLLLSDVVLPHMSGPQLAQRVASLRPDMRVLFMSGYAGEAVVRHGILDSGVAFLQKPFTPELLTATVREVLGPGEGAR